ncbi:MAG: proteasome-activating nucleotidase, partial [Thermoprotei archaeon]
MSSDVRKYYEARIDEDDYIRLLESKIKYLETEKEKLLMKIRYYKSEIEKLLSPPLIEAVVLSILDDGRVVVKSS